MDKKKHELCNEYNTNIGDRVKVLESTENHFFDKGEIFVVTEILRIEKNKLLFRGGMFGRLINANKCFKKKTKKL